MIAGSQTIADDRRRSQKIEHGSISSAKTKTIRAKQAKVHSAYFVQRDQHAIIARDLT